MNTSVMHEPLADAVRATRRHMIATTHATWPDGAALLDRIVGDPLAVPVAIPIAAGLAAGADIADTVPFAAAWGLIAIASRVLDDCADQDNPSGLDVLIGAPRAWNFGTALMVHAAAQIQRLPFAGARVQRTLAAFFEMAGRAFIGQDLDLRNTTSRREDYLQIVEDKTAGGFAFGALGAAMMHTDDPMTLDACRRFGRHLGVMTQVLDDLEACWFSDGPSDLELGRRTLALYIGLEQTHPRRDELAALVDGADAARIAASAPRILELLDVMEVRRLLVFAALEERDAALANLATCGQPAAMKVAEASVELVFADAAALLTTVRR